MGDAVSSGRCSPQGEDLRVAEEHADSHVELVSGDAQPYVNRAEAKGRNGFVLRVREVSAAVERSLRPVGMTLKGAIDSIECSDEKKASSSMQFKRVTLKCMGVNDEINAVNVRIQDAIRMMTQLLQPWPSLQIRSADTEAELNEALKLYRDMNHLSLAGGITCEQVLHHLESHTVLLYYKAADDEMPIAVTAATFSMRESSMMLRLLATHPRMTRKGFARITVHFLKELCRALQKSEILVYTYPSSASFYKAMNFRHTHKELPRPAPPSASSAAPSTAAAAGSDSLESAAPPQLSREEAREARRVFSAQENEMIFYVQPTFEQVVNNGFKQGATAHPYACTRRRMNQPPQEQSEESRLTSKTAISCKQQPAARKIARRMSVKGAAGTGVPAADTAPGTSAASAPAASALSKCSSSGTSDTSALLLSPLFTSPPAMRPSEGGGAPGFPTVGDVVASTPSCRGHSAAEGTAAEDSAPPRRQPSPHGARVRPPAAVARSLDDANRVLPADGFESEEGGRPLPPGSREQDDDDTSVDDACEVPDGCEAPSHRKRKLPKGEYHVESIVGVRSCGGQVQYLIKWEGWTSKFNTWEPVSNLQNLQAEIASFESSLRSARGCTTST